MRSTNLNEIFFNLHRENCKQNCCIQLRIILGKFLQVKNQYFLCYNLLPFSSPKSWCMVSFNKALEKKNFILTSDCIDNKYSTVQGYVTLCTHNVRLAAEVIGYHRCELSKINNYIKYQFASFDSRSILLEVKPVYSSSFA